MAKKQTDLPGVDGPGVGEVTDKKLDKLADEFKELRDNKAQLAEDITATEKKILDRMKELNIPVYRYSDQLVKIAPGADHVKIKTVKVGDEDGDEDEAEDE